VAVASALAALAPAPALAAPRLRPPAADLAGSSAGSEAARVRAFWTPRRMIRTRPLDRGAVADPLATASFSPLVDATLPPYLVNGRLFVRQGRSRGYCSATAIDSPTRRLVLTAGHCINSGPRGLRGTSAWSRYVLFVPAYTDGQAPFGSFVARRPDVFAP
jgi:hypothetical protein